MNIETIILYKTMNQEELNRALKIAIISELFEDIQYLLSSPDLQLHANLYYDDNYAFYFSVRENNTQLFSFLTPMFLYQKEKLPQLDKIFSIAYHNWQHTKDMSIISSLIWDYDISLTGNVSAIIMVMDNDDIRQIFSLRDLNKELHKDLIKKSKSIKIDKI